VQNYSTFIFSPLQPTGRNFKNFLNFYHQIQKMKKKFGEEDAEMVKVLHFSPKIYFK
jgi:hypothetical protein